MICQNIRLSLTSTQRPSDLLHLRDGVGEVIGLVNLVGGELKNVEELVAGLQCVKHLLAGQVLPALFDN